jgi:hypothetical protein
MAEAPTVGPPALAYAEAAALRAGQAGRARVRPASRNPRLNRPRTLAFKVTGEDDELTVVRRIKQVISNVSLEGIYKDTHADLNLFYVTFESSNDMKEILTSEITNNPSGSYQCKRADDMGRDTRMRVELRSVPLELPDHDVRLALEHWFTVAEVTRSVYGREADPELRGLQNGRRVIVVDQVLNALPAAVRIRDRTYSVRFYAPPEKQFCWNCWRQGHTRLECQYAPACRYCRAEDHDTRECPRNPGAQARREREKTEHQTTPNVIDAVAPAASQATVIEPEGSGCEAHEATAAAGSKAAEGGSVTRAISAQAGMIVEAFATPKASPKETKINLDVEDALVALKDLQKLKHWTSDPALYSEKAAQRKTETFPKPITTGHKMTVLRKGKSSSRPPTPAINTKSTPQTKKDSIPNRGSSEKRKPVSPPAASQKKAPTMSNRDLMKLAENITTGNEEVRREAADKILACTPHSKEKTTSLIGIQLAKLSPNSQKKWFEWTSSKPGK